MEAKLGDGVPGEGVGQLASSLHQGCGGVERETVEDEESPGGDGEEGIVPGVALGPTETVEVEVERTGRLGDLAAEADPRLLPGEACEWKA